MSTIVDLTSLQQLSSILSSSKDKLTVIDFHASWCGPCHAIAPVYEKLSKEYKNVNFLKCDVDAAQEVAGEYSVRAMPTFVFLKGSVKVDQVQGANPRALESTIKTHAGSGPASTGAFTGKGQTLSGSSSKSNVTSTPGPVSGLTNLDPQVKIFLGLIGVYLVLWYFNSA
ncbi:thioredoxin-domain-containing protein [Hysterangium stoloniferum]|nr:thioredoxin-domain-containing protein [Hysterangium stoloniferum]